MKVWTSEEEKYLIDNYECTQQELIIKKLKRRWSGIKAKAAKLGLKRDYFYTRKSNYQSYTVRLFLDGKMKRSWFFQRDERSKRQKKWLIKKLFRDYADEFTGGTCYISILHGLENFK